MNLKEKIDADIKSAMLSKDNVKKDLLKFIKSEVQRAEGGLKVLDDADVQKIMRTQIENLKVTSSDTSEQEIKILESYLPSLMTEEEIKSEIEKFVSSKENSTIGDVMKHFSTNFKGRADNKIVSVIAKESLTKTA